MIPSTEEFRLVFKSPRRVGTPLVAVQTADPASAMTHVTGSVNAKKGQTPLISWDFGSRQEFVEKRHLVLNCVN